MSHLYKVLNHTVGFIYYHPTILPNQMINKWMNKERTFPHERKKPSVSSVYANTSQAWNQPSRCPSPSQLCFPSEASGVSHCRDAEEPPRPALPLGESDGQSQRTHNREADRHQEELFCVTVQLRGFRTSLQGIKNSLAKPWLAVTDSIDWVSANTGLQDKSSNA